MKFHDLTLHWIIWRNGEFHFVLGCAAGRVPYEPEAHYLYSLRLFLGVAKLEILWQTGKPREEVWTA